MARHLTLLALIACAAAARRSPQHSSEASDSDLDPFALWEDYDTYETPLPSRSTTKPSAKVILKTKVPTLNVTMKNKSELKGNGKDNKNKIIKTTINIQSHTNFIVTKRPALTESPLDPFTRIPLQSVVELGDQQVWVGDAMHKPTRSTKKPTTSRRPNTSRKPSTTRRPQRTTRRRTVTTSRQSTARPVRHVTKATKAPSNKKPTCPPKKAWWLSSFFQDNKAQKSNKKQVKTGFFTKVYQWLMGSKSSWFSGNWFDEVEAKTSTTSTTTTPIPPTTSTNNWFQDLLDSEENDVAESTTNANKKPPKKAAKKNYKGYQLLRAFPDTQWKIRALLELQEDSEGSGLLWWTAPSLNGSTDLLVPPDLLVDVKDHLKSSMIEFDVIIWDLQKAITYENPRLSKKQRLELEQLRGHPMTWRRYHRYADVLRYLEYLQHSYTDVVELVPLGHSSEGRPLVAVKVSLPSNETQTVSLNTKGQKKKWKLRSHMKPAVWLEGGAHAREWIAPAVVSWMLHTLVEGPDLEMLNMADFYILPVLNPDGYEHSHTHDRLWRKTRSRVSDNSDDYYTGWLPWNWGQTDCVGVDVDRNWDYHWGEKDSSRDACSENYAGPHPFSEPETRAVSNFLSERKGQIKVYITLHAYSQAWLVPSSHTVAPFPDEGVLLEMGKLATAALADLYGTKYQVGSADEIRQPASGMSHDWAKARAGIKYSYHVNLRDSYGPYGFLLPGSQIVPTARETWQAVKTIVDNLTPGV
ncbi:carboxypeptidase A2-like [Epargyreus clarus]|uniref:carboxypeptidase A2-like n=1 Tax=Epargyreus clarus TaxID=520877 RepID=UPI003C2F23EB